MPTTNDYKIFADRYHKKQHLPDDLIKTIMDINTKNIEKEKQYKNEHKQKFNIVVREIYSILMDLMMEGNVEDLSGNPITHFNIMINHSKCLTLVEGYKNIYQFNTGMDYVYTKDMIIIYDSLEDCINNINGVNEWELELNTAEFL